MKKTKKIFSSLLLSVTLVIPMFATGTTAATTYDNGEEKLRVYIESTNKQASKEAKDKYNVRWDFNGKGFTTNVTEKQYEALQKNKNLSVELVNKHSINILGGSKTQATPVDQTPWGIEAIYNDHALVKTSGGEGVVVAVLDTGTMKNHVDLENRIQQCKDFSNLLFSLVNNSCNDVNGHGTHVSGTVLADGGDSGTGIYGVAPEATLWSYKVLGDAGFGFSDDIAGAIRHATDEAKRLGVNLIISMSLGSDAKDSMIEDAVKYANNNGVLVVAAAGNSGPDENTIGYPGGLAEAVGVASLEDVQENGTYRVSDFSSRGNPDTDGDYVITEADVELSAPGGNILSTWNDGSYNTISGTSMATPHISGLAAKIWAENPSLNNHQLRVELQNRAKLNDIKGGLHATDGDDIASGFGFPKVK
jgi:subtilisin